MFISNDGRKSVQKFQCNGIWMFAFYKYFKRKKHLSFFFLKLWISSKIVAKLEWKSEKNSNKWMRNGKSCCLAIDCVQLWCVFYGITWWTKIKKMLDVCNLLMCAEIGAAEKFNVCRIFAKWKCAQNELTWHEMIPMEIEMELKSS